MEALGAQLPVAIGDVVAEKYRIERLIGRGGMGCVFQATHVQLLQRVAVKVLYAAALRHDGARTRFLREARAAAALTSEHVARVIDVDVLPSGVPYLIIEHLEGEDLAARLERGPLLVDEAVKLMMQACDALGEAHRLGIVHRDIKPHNLFLVKRASGAIALKVLDFGIAKVDTPTLGGGGDVITGTCAVMGTPQYMAPEQMTSTRSVDASADVWALGVCLYEALTLRRPFESSNMLELGALVMTGRPTTITTHRADLPPSLVAVIDRCLAKDSTRRFADANELHAALEGSQEKATVVTPRTLVTPQFRVSETLQTPRTPGALAAPVFSTSPVMPVLSSPRHSAPPAPPLATATSFGDPGMERMAAAAAAAAARGPSSRTTTSIGLGLVVALVAIAVGVKIARRDPTPPTDQVPTAVAVPPLPATQLVDPPPSPSAVLTPTTTIAGASTGAVTAPATTGAQRVRHPGGTVVRPKTPPPPPPPPSPAPAPTPTSTPTAAPTER